MKQLKQLEEDEEYPLKIRQDSYTSIMEYSISDHKPVVGIFTLEVRIWSNTWVLYSVTYMWLYNMRRALLLTDLSHTPFILLSDGHAVVWIIYLFGSWTMLVLWREQILLKPTVGYCTNKYCLCVQSLIYLCSVQWSTIVVQKNPQTIK